MSEPHSFIKPPGITAVEAEALLRLVDNADRSASAQADLNRFAAKHGIASGTTDARVLNKRVKDLALGTIQFLNRHS